MGVHEAVLAVYKRPPAAHRLLFAVALFPTVVLNGAYWAQCDSIYTFFAVLSLYLALSDKPVGAMVTITASFAFKLQAVFVMPIFFVLLVAKKIKFKHLFIFPAAYLVMVLPAVIAGRPLWDTLTLYFSQAGTVGDAMNYNAPSLTSMFQWGENTEMWSMLLVIAAFVFMFIVFAVAISNRKSLTTVSFSAWRCFWLSAYRFCFRICTTAISSPAA